MLLMMPNKIMQAINAQLKELPTPHDTGYVKLTQSAPDLGMVLGAHLPSITHVLGPKWD